MTGSTPVPREGLPPCFRMVVYEDRRVLMHDGRHEGGIIHLAATYFKGEWIEAWHCGRRRGVRNYPSSDSTRESPFIAFPKTDVEMEAAWERAERWVRTGVLDEVRPPIVSR